MEEAEEYVDMIIKYKDWIAIKRLGIRQNTKPEEVVFHLAGMRESIYKKAYLILGINTEALDKYADSITSGMKKNTDSLKDAVSKLTTSSTKEVLKSSCTNVDYVPFAETYLLNKLIKNIGYDTYVNQQAMSKVFPYLKIKKPMGRTPKK